MGRSYYQQFYFDKEELDFVSETLSFFENRKENLEKQENMDDTLLKLRRVELTIKAIKYFYGL